MGTLAYYASRISDDKPNWFVTPENFRIYRSSPICRTGYQEYAGRELKNHIDYDPAWDIDDDDIVKVYRPKEVVTAPETIASFEGKSVCDDHPPKDVSLILLDNEAEYGRGHGQNVRIGEPMEDGETPLLADLFVKDRELNDKIDSGIRDISCGYLFNMTRREDGTLVMTKIVGNHIAVVSKGRAGPEVAIQDSAINVPPPAAQTTQPIRNEPERPKRKEPMKKGTIWGRMLKAFAADAEPEELAEAAKLASKDSEEPEDEKEEKSSVKDRKAARDKKSAKDADEPEEKAAMDVDFYWDAANQKAVPILNSKGYSKRKAGDSAEEVDNSAKDAADYELHPELKTACDHIAHMRSAMDAMVDHLGIGKGKAAKDADGNEEKDDKDKSAKDEANVLELSGDEKGDTELPKQIASDSAAFLKAVKPLVAASNDKSLISNFNAHVRSLKGNSAASDDDPYADLAHTVGVALDSSASGEEQIDPAQFFNGVTFAEGQRRWKEAMAATKGTK